MGRRSCGRPGCPGGSRFCDAGPAGWLGRRPWVSARVRPSVTHTHAAAVSEPSVCVVGKVTPNHPASASGRAPGVLVASPSSGGGGRARAARPSQGPASRSPGPVRTACPRECRPPAAFPCPGNLATGAIATLAFWESCRTRMCRSLSIRRIRNAPNLLSCVTLCDVKKKILSNTQAGK